MYIMNLNSLLKSKKCSCGEIHTCFVDKIIVKPNAINSLKTLSKDYSEILVVLDENTYNFAGSICSKALNTCNHRYMIFKTNVPLIPNEDAVLNLQSQLKTTDLIIGVGSGVIQDLCKYVSFNAKLPYFIIPTAPSMDGYASSTAIMTFNGVKTSIPCKPPKAIICDTNLLKNAPLRMIQSGYGDILGKISALNDWKLSSLINGEYFCNKIYRLTEKSLKNVLKLTKQLKMRKPVAIKALMEALLITGISMSYLGNSRSASGSEHLLSHFFEDLGMINGESYLPHGIDVAYSTYITCKLRNKLLKAKLPNKIYQPDRDTFVREMNKMFKNSAEKLILNQDKFDESIKERALSYNNEKDIKKILKKASNPDKVKKLIEEIGLDINEFYKTYTQEKIDKAIIYAKNVRTRFTVLHLYLDVFKTEKLS